MATETRTIQVLDPRPEDIPEEQGMSAGLPKPGGEDHWGAGGTPSSIPTSSYRNCRTVLEQEYNAEKVIYAKKFSFSAPCSDETIDSPDRGGVTPSYTA